MTERPKVLFVSNIVTAGGSEAVLSELVSRMGDSAFVVVPRGEVLDEMHRIGANVQRIRGPLELRRATNPLWFIAGIGRALLGCLEVAVVVLREKPDIVHANNLAAGIYALLPATFLGKTRVWHIHDVLRRRSLEARLVRLIYRLADILVVPSSAARESLLSVGVPSERVTIVHSGIDSRSTFDPDRLTRGPVRRDLALADDDVCVISVVGHLSPGKGVHVLLNALQELSTRSRDKIHVLLAGTTPPQDAGYEQSLREMVGRSSALRGKITFLGRRTDIAQLLRDTDILVQPSMYPEAFGRAVVEAMAMRTVVVAARTGALPELIDDRITGYLFEPGDSLDLAAKLEQAIKDPEPSIIGRAARQKVLEDYDLKSRDAMLTKVYEAYWAPRRSKRIARRHTSAGE